MKLTEQELRRKVLLSFQVALLGMVPPSLRGVTVGWSEDHIEGRCLFDGPTDEAEFELCSDIESEIMASFPDFDVTVIAARSDFPRDLRQELLDAWVYRRQESP